MADYLADVVMPPASGAEEKKDMPPVEDFMPEEVDDINDINDEDDEEVIPEPVQKVKIPQDEIFKKKVNSVIEETISASEEKPKQVRRKGKIMTEKQLQILREGRLKGLETRRKNADAKRLAKLQAQEDKDLLEQVKQTERKRLKKKLESGEDITEPPKAVQIVEKEKIIEKGYSQEQLDDAVRRAVEESVNKVEILRKQRKEVKKKAQAKEKHDQQVFKQINSAIKPSGWDHCFM